MRCCAGQSADCTVRVRRRWDFAVFSDCAGQSPIALCGSDGDGTLPFCRTVRVSQSPIALCGSVADRTVRVRRRWDFAVLSHCAGQSVADRTVRVRFFLRRPPLAARFARRSARRSVHQTLKQKAYILE